MQELILSANERINNEKKEKLVKRIREKENPERAEKLISLINARGEGYAIDL